MATLIQEPSAYNLSSTIEDIIFGSSSESANLVLTLATPTTTYNILDETVYPDSDNTVAISDLSALLEPYLKNELVGTLACTLTDDTSAVSISNGITVLYAKVDVGMDAQEFLNSHFLTILDGTKLTAYERAERLHIYYGAVETTPASIPSAVITARVRYDSGSFATLTGEITAAAESYYYAQYDVSVQNIEDVLGLDGGSILSYTITVGSRSQEFQVVEDVISPAPSLIFTNSFGCQEFIHCVGTHKKDSKYERQSARFSGKLRNYRVTEDRQFTANTGWLNSPMADWADDLFRSEEVYLWLGQSVGRAVVVSDSHSVITNEDDDMPAFEFVYGYAQRIHNVMQPGRAGRIFDNTFDNTFD